MCRNCGVGPRTTALALFDFLLLWEAVCRFSGAEFPVKKVRVVGIDRTDDALRYAQRVVAAVAGRVEAWLRARAESRDRLQAVSGAQTSHGWVCVIIEAARETVWDRADQCSRSGQETACRHAREANLIVASYVIT